MDEERKKAQNAIEQKDQTENALRYLNQKYNKEAGPFASLLSSADVYNTKTEFKFNSIDKCKNNINSLNDLNNKTDNIGKYNNFNNTNCSNLSNKKNEYNNDIKSENNDIDFLKPATKFTAKINTDTNYESTFKSKYIFIIV